MKHLIAITLLSFLTMETLQAGTTHLPDSVYLFSYNNGNPNDGLRFAYSIDGTQFVPIDGSFLKSDFGTWGREKKMYAPSLIQKDGRWYAVWQLNSRVDQFATTCSDDLCLWKPQDYPYMHQDEAVQQPVLQYDGMFIVCYSTNKSNYYQTTSYDFRTWSAPQPISRDAYSAVCNARATKANIGGTSYPGEIHRVPYSLVQNYMYRAGYADARNTLNNEPTSDATFKGINGLKATLDIYSQQTKDISSNLIGIFFEDINYSADGGLYAELIQNRDFEYNNLDRGEWNAKSFWTLVGEGTSFNIDTDSPIHANNPNYAVLQTRQVGASLQNNGFDGIVLRKGDKYDLSLFLRSLDGQTQKVCVSLIDGQQTLATTTFSVPKDGNWKQLKAVLRSSADATNASIAIQPLTTGRLGVDFVSLFPQKTFKNRKNGLRADLAQTLADLHPRFIRFPGGCVSHGNGLDNMYRWRTTIGPLWERKHQSNIWGYHQSKGLGFYEYFQFCEDIGAQPLPVLPAAVPCQNSSRGGDGQQGGMPMSQLDDYVQELFELVEWANGDAKTSPLARMRAEAGHQRPFNLKYLGIGNEDLISDVFVERFNYIFDAFQRQHPEITIVGTVGPFFEGSDYEFGWELARQKKVPVVDEHYYVSPGWYINNQYFYDSYDRSQPTRVYLGEWASRGNQLENALAEALHITNLERNADMVVMSSYAPLLAKRGHTQWNPDLIYFDNSSVSPTVNYYVQQLCGNNSGNQYISNQLNVLGTADRNGTLVNVPHDGATKRVTASVVRDSATGDLILKLVNITPFDTPVDMNLHQFDTFSADATVSTLCGQLRDREVKPQISTLSIDNPHFTYTLPPYSFTVIRLKIDL